jgi:hypothetical protein
VVAFHGRNTQKMSGTLGFALFLFYIKQKTGGNHMKKTKIILNGTVCVQNLSKEVQESFYSTVFVRILALHDGKAV